MAVKMVKEPKEKKVRREEAVHLEKTMDQAEGEESTVDEALRQHERKNKAVKKP